MTDGPVITVSELRTAIGRILDAVEHRFGEDLRFPIDYYWAVVGDAYALAEKPELVVGQVSDDAASVRDLLAQPVDEYVVIQHESGHFRGLLQAIEHLDSNPSPRDNAVAQPDETPHSRHARWWGRRHR